MFKISRAPQQPGQESTMVPRKRLCEEFYGKKGKMVEENHQDYYLIGYTR